MRATSLLFFFFFNDTATTEIYTLSLHDALPICICHSGRPFSSRAPNSCRARGRPAPGARRSEEHTSELQSRLHLVCRLLLEKKKRLYILFIILAVVVVYTVVTYSTTARADHF